MFIFAYMLKAEVYKTIKSTVVSVLPGAKVFLFGSRARGDFRKWSDYDLLIVTEQTYPPRVKIDLESRVNKALVYTLNAPFDVILQSNEEVDVKRNLIGHIVRSALKDAVEI